MGKMEEAARVRTKKNQLQRIILGTVKTAGIISVALVAPNVLGAMAKMGLIPSNRQKEVIRRSTDQLVKAGHMRWESGKLRITERGEAQLQRMLWKKNAQRPWRWDKKWRVLVFDIPEKRKGLRQRIRHMLRDVGFTLLQESVWVYPYDCEDLIALLKADLRVGNSMRYMIVDSIENDTKLRTHFGLSA